MSKQFEPIAIVGRGCILPGCRTPAELWQTVIEGRDQLSAAPAGDWRVDLGRVVGGASGRPPADRAWTDRGGYVRDFAEVFDPAASTLDAELVAQLDPVFQWSLYAAGQALAETGGGAPEPARAGVVLGNLSYPTRAHNRLAEQTWLPRLLGREVRPAGDVHAWNRFMSGLPAMLVARACGFAGGSLALDAACASGLYAIKIACDRLQDRQADLMLAGGVNAADQLFLHVGFSSLNALSRSGRSRPFHREADGLVPAEGAAFVALKRLDDALAAGDRVFGVIHGVGLSNDGRSGGFLSPSRAGQVRSMRAALAQTGLAPEAVQYVECHATGTPVGDATEIASLREVYGERVLALGSLKANLGHLITASGVAGLLKTLAAMEHGQIPPAPGSRPLHGALEDSGFIVPETAQAWAAENGQRIAAVSSFGFGGNNAHLILAQNPGPSGPLREAPSALRSPLPSSSPAPRAPLAIVGLGLRTHLDKDAARFAARQFGDGAAAFDAGTLSLPAHELGFPPAELRRALGQQLLLLEVARQATADLGPLEPTRSGVFVGMQTDSEACRYGLRLRLPELLRSSGLDADAGWLAEALDAAAPPLDSAGVIGTMPNVAANRLSNGLNLQGPGFAVSREELSGDAALELAASALRRGEIAVALVAAVDLCREPVHEHAAGSALGEAAAEAADAAVLLAVKTEVQAKRDGDRILALLLDTPARDDAESLFSTAEQSPLRATLGHAHCASGLLHLALGVQMLAARVHLNADGTPQPWLQGRAPRQLRLCNRSFAGEEASWLLQEGPRAGAVQNLLPTSTTPRLRRYAAADLGALRARLGADEPGGQGSCRLALFGRPEQFDALRARALQVLESGDVPPAWSLEGIACRAGPLAGELAFAFTGAASAYAGMGRDLLLRMPRLLDDLGERLIDQRALADWVWRPGDPRADLPAHQLAGSTFVCQVHAELSLRILGLRPDAVIGLSSGETNAMFAFGVWRDLDAMITDIDASPLYHSALAGDFEAVREHWKLAPEAPLRWENYRVRVDVDAVRAGLAGRDRVYLCIVNSPRDCVIGGDADACAELLAALGQPLAVPLGHDLAVHCEAVRPFAAAWRALHTRPVHAGDGPRFYSNYFGDVFAPTTPSVAEALTGQALQAIDFPRIVEQAWRDGVRIFVEHGPRGSLCGAIAEILGDREHLAVALDRPGVPGLTQALQAAAQLWCAGVDLRLDAFEPAPTQDTRPADEGPLLSFRLRLPAPDLPLPTPTEATPPVYRPPALNVGLRDGRLMPPAPALALVEPEVDTAPPGALHAAVPGAAPTQSEPATASLSTAQALAAPASVGPSTAHAPGSLAAPAVAAPASPVPSPPPSVASPHSPTGVPGLLLTAHAGLVSAHQDYLRAQQGAMAAYLESLARIRETVFGAPRVPRVPSASRPPPASTDPGACTAAAAPVTKAEPPGAVAQRDYPGPAFDRAQLEVLASGRISSVFGARFSGQDDYAVQVRLPEPPLLLCDRVLGIEGEPHSMGKGTIWTETDVRADSWYLHHGRMPAGILIESGQADLLLISWLGIDACNKGERAYRLLGCELIFHGDLPQPGETLEYAIRADGHARQGDVRLFFFSYDCRVDGDVRISVRNGQAGFFSPEELRNSAGVLWSPEAATYTENPVLAPPPATPDKTCFSDAEVEAYLAGDLERCFGSAFRWAHTHTRTPRTPAGRQNFLGEVTAFELSGGPAGRGYLRVEKAVRPDDWFFAGHFKNDPCMPGTLMAEACLQAMAFYLVATGRTLRRDGWRFQPVRGLEYKFICRGQVTPESRRITYEIFVDDVDDGEQPTLFAHVLCSVDGRKAFLCERLGLELVPDWPLSSLPQYLAEQDDPRPVARLDGLPLDYRALIHCAWGRPTGAFGPGFARYDGPLRSPRLPGPPFHFMTRITDVHGAMAGMKAGARVSALYDIEPDAWYFHDNPAGTMPNCVLMEIALQPCGWLASYSLGGPVAQQELLFRNLDGEALQHREIGPDDGSILTEVELLSVSQAGELIIEKFAVRCSIDGEEVLRVETVFGFFPPAAMADQKGFGAAPEDLARLQQDSAVSFEISERPPQLYPPQLARLPEGRLLMIDRISGYWPEGGAQGLGAIRAEKVVGAGDWFFKAHFFQDPVKPGSLGVEAMLQTMQALMLLQGMDAGIQEPRFQSIAIGSDSVWHYRGQVTPEKGCVTVEFEVEERGRDEAGAFIIGFARLWVDGLQIYQAPRLGMRIVPGESRGPAGRDMEHKHSWQVDLQRPEHAWLADHCPTYTLPALPFSCELELMVASAARHYPGASLQAVERAEAQHWVVFHRPVIDGRCTVSLQEDGRARVSLEQRRPDGGWQPAASAVLRFGADRPRPDLPPLEALRDAAPVDDPYADGSLFHGPRLQLMKSLLRGSNGARATLAPPAAELSRGLLNPAVLDAALHCIPHDALHSWSPAVAADLAAYPLRIERLQLFGDLTLATGLSVEARFAGLEAERFPRSHLRLLQGHTLLAAFDLVEILLPKGRLGNVSGRQRRAFLAERRFVPGLSLSHCTPASSRLLRREMEGNDWLPGTVARGYGLCEGADLALEVVQRDHLGQLLRLHPSAVTLSATGLCLNLPLNACRITTQADVDGVTVTGRPEALDRPRIARYWTARTDGDLGFVRDLGVALIRAFVRRVVLADPAGFEALRGRPVLYLGNHQTGVESFLFLTIVAALTGFPAAAIAKKEHGGSWIGKYHRLTAQALGDANPLSMLLFDRSRQSDLLRLLQDYRESLTRKPCSLLVHADGTRAQMAGAPVRAVSSVLIDLALEHALPIVPVRFAGGLPRVPVEQRQEFPWRLGQQDYYLGAAIAPDDLRAMPFAQRARHVIARIEALGPAGEADQPLPGLGGLAEAVAVRRNEGFDELTAVLRAALALLPERSAETERLLAEEGGGEDSLACELLGAGSTVNIKGTNP